MSDDNLIKVIFDLDPDDWHLRAAESCWAEPIMHAVPGAAVLQSSPFFKRGVSYLDILRVYAEQTERGPLFRFAEVIACSGHSTYMLLVPPICPAFEGYWIKLEKLGCSYESAPGLDTSHGQKTLYSVDVPPTADIYAVHAILMEGVRDKIWIFQEGHIEHKLKSTAPPN